MNKIEFKKFTSEDIALYYQWAEKDHVKQVWFLDGYQRKEYILEKIKGNGIEYPFVIMIDNRPIGYIQCWDVDAQNLIQKEKNDHFSKEPPKTYGIDLFIGEEEYLGKGYGTKIVQEFSRLLFKEYGAQKLVIDPSVQNTKAIRCYEKAGFKFSRFGKDDVSGTLAILEMTKP